MSCRINMLDGSVPEVCFWGVWRGDEFGRRGQRMGDALFWRSRVWKGRLAQLVEHLRHMQRVIGSSPLAPTIFLAVFN